MVGSIREMEDFIPGIVAMTVDFFGALFVSVCMSTAGSMYLSALFIVADVAQSVLEFREIRTNANTALDLLQDLKTRSSKHRTLVGCSGTCDLVDLILSVTRDPNAFHMTSSSCVRVYASYPHRIAREHSESLRVLHAMNGEPDALSPPLRPKQTSRWPHERVQVQSAAIVPTASRPDASSTCEKVNEGAPTVQDLFTTTSSANSKRLVQQGLQLMFHCEYLILVEYVECVVPLIFVLYKLALEQLPNVVYYPGGAGQFGAAAVVNVLVFAALETISLLLLHLFLQRKFAFSPLYQLAFVLETQFYMVQAQLFVESIFLLQYELEHYGTDFTFQFEWLQRQQAAYP